MTTYSVQVFGQWGGTERLLGTWEAYAHTANEAALAAVGSAAYQFGYPSTTGLRPVVAG
jgi:hypothetical protein